MAKIENMKADCSKYFTGQCDCGAPQCCLRVVFDIYDEKDPFVEICIMNHTHAAFLERLGVMLKILFNKDYVFSGVIFGKDEWNKLREFVLAKKL